MRKKSFFLILSLGILIFYSCGNKKELSDVDFQSLIQPVPESAKFINDSLFIWGGSLIRSEADGKYHLFYSQWPKDLGMKGWVTHSEVAHAVAESPLGPFHFSNVALPARGRTWWDGMVTHNPTIRTMYRYL